MMHRSVSLCLLSCILLISGCARPPRQPGTLRLAAPGDPSTLDPAKAYDTTSIGFVRVLYRGLVDYDQKGNLINAVAAQRKVSPDGKTYWFKLRRDVRFHSGRQVVADDFRYAIERVLDPATASDGLAIFKIIDGAEEFIEDREKSAEKKQKPKLPHVRGIRVQGDDEISFTLKKPDATFINYLALPFGYAVPRDYVQELTRKKLNLSEHPNGCGPFVLEDWVHDGWLHLRKNPNYFEPGLPKCERIELSIGISPTLQIMLFDQGHIDILSLEDVASPDYLRLKQDPKWQPYMLHAPMMDIRYVCLNTELKPFDNVLVRRAMNYAVNRERIAAMLAQRVTLAKGPLPPGMPAYNPHLFQYSYDPAKAKQLLKQAGYANGFSSPVTLWYATNLPWYEKAAQSIKEDLKQVGIEINLKATTYPELKTAAGKRRNIQMCIIGWIQDFLDPANFLDVLLNGHNITDTASNNRAFYSNPKVNKLLDAAGVEVNKAKRLKLYQEAEKMIDADAPRVFLHHTERYLIHQP
ncbi:MAG: ABC transporter substrate-binding protein, partial [Armatimonadota bacterium]|nr:ABC transporter substrate-binding protein [Armatimonadota bacterium]